MEEGRGVGKGTGSARASSLNGKVVALLHSICQPVFNHFNAFKLYLMATGVAAAGGGDIVDVTAGCASPPLHLRPFSTTYRQFSRPSTSSLTLIEFFVATTD